jgi:hypothetical protein
MITHGMVGLSRGIWANRLNTKFKSFTSEVFILALPPVGLAKGALEKIQVSPEFDPFWNEETDMSSWSPQKLMHKNIFLFCPLVRRVRVFQRQS